MLAVSASLVLRCVLRGGEDWASVYQVPRPHSIGCLPPCSLPPTARHYRFLLQRRRRDKGSFPLGQFSLDCLQDVGLSGPSLVNVSQIMVSGTACQRQAASTLIVKQVCAVQSIQAHGVLGNITLSSVQFVYDSIRSVTLQWRLQHRQAVSRCMEQRRRRISRVASARPYF